MSKYSKIFLVCLFVPVVSFSKTIFSTNETGKQLTIYTDGSTNDFIFTFCNPGSITFFTTGEWKQIYNENEIKVSEQETICTSKNGHKFLVSFLKIENLGNTDKTVEWDVNKYNSDNICIDCNNGSTENHKTIRIKAGETLEGVCEGNQLKQLKVSKKYIPVETKSKSQDNTVKFNNFIVKKAE